MNKKSYKWVVYFIGITIILTIAVQVYWNYREYQINKHNLIGKVQRSLDKGVEDYYANLTRSGFITVTANDSLNPSKKIDTFTVKTNSRRALRKKIDSTLDNIVKQDSGRILFINDYRKGPHYLNAKNLSKNLDLLISKVAVSFSRDSLDLAKLNDHIVSEFERNNIDVKYALKLHYLKWITRDSSEKN